MGPCSIVAIYSAVILILLVLSILSIRLKWHAFFVRLFVAAALMGMLAYPIAVHKYSVGCYRGPCETDT